MRGGGATVTTKNKKAGLFTSQHSASGAATFQWWGGGRGCGRGRGCLPLPLAAATRPSTVCVPSCRTGTNCCSAGSSAGNSYLHAQGAHVCVCARACAGRSGGGGERATKGRSGRAGEGVRVTSGTGRSGVRVESKRMPGLSSPLLSSRSRHGPLASAAFLMPIPRHRQRRAWRGTNWIARQGVAGRSEVPYPMASRSTIQACARATSEASKKPRSCSATKSSSMRPGRCCARGRNSPTRNLTSSEALAKRSSSASRSAR